MKPPAAKEVSAAPPEPAPPLSFAGFRATAVNGDPVDLSRRRAPNVVLYFWSARTPRGIRSTEPVEALYETYHSRGVDVVGIASAANASQLAQVMSENEVTWPQVCWTRAASPAVTMWTQPNHILSWIKAAR